MAGENDPGPKQISSQGGGSATQGDRWITTGAGNRKYIYSTFEKSLAGMLAVYLFVALFGVFWFIFDVWANRFSLFNMFGYGEVLGALPKGRLPLMKLVIYCIAGGWLGGTLSAMRSLQLHYASPVEDVGDEQAQEENRFHPGWWMRWCFGPWIGAGLALVVLALVRSGMLVFAASEASGTVTATENFATLGLGALVGLGAKEVVQKLIDALKKWLRVEEPEIKELTMSPEAPPDVQYGGNTIKFKVSPKIPVTWALTPSDEATAGTITNGVFLTAKKAPDDALDSRNIVVTATSKTDSDRSVSTTVILKKS
ncbi:MAG: hypothetical protein O7H41_12960 [Planctomycetota bacterium]|nr:hypothetical protein [Planctomycetota bacterium]